LPFQLFGLSLVRAQSFQGPSKPGHSGFEAQAFLLTNRNWCIVNEDANTPTRELLFNAKLVPKNTMNTLINKHCRPYSLEEKPLDIDEIELLSAQTPDWHYLASEKQIKRAFSFKNFYQTMDFLNHVAEICHQQDHHPQIQLSYKHCLISFNTHTVRGVTANDFICAAKIDQININKLNIK
jgi:4a-hydroxytetrahydrobiopterin dehydratase